MSQQQLVIHIISLLQRGRKVDSSKCVQIFDGSLVDRIQKSMEGKPFYHPRINPDQTGSVRFWRDTSPRSPQGSPEKAAAQE